MDSQSPVGAVAKTSQPQWYPLKSARKGKKKGTVSGEVQLKFSLYDPSNPNATPAEIYAKLVSSIRSSPGGEDEDDEGGLSQQDSMGLEELEQEEREEREEQGEEASDETDDPTKPEISEKKKKRLRLARLRRKSIAVRAYQFTGEGNDVVGMLFLEIKKIVDLPPERNSKFSWCTTDIVVGLTRRNSDSNFFRHGPIRCGLLGSKDISYKGHQAQSESDIRGENDFPGHAPRGILFHELLGR
jgi:phosphatidylserine decarboxylase